MSIYVVVVLPDTCSASRLLNCQSCWEGGMYGFDSTITALFTSYDNAEAIALLLLANGEFRGVCPEGAAGAYGSAATKAGAGQYTG